ncbi:hypothetical protein V8B97DRAFT_1555767 [Scleroderma yunnanense]
MLSYLRGATDTMDTPSTDTLNKLVRSRSISPFSFLQPALVFAPHSQCSCNPIALYSDPDCQHSSLARNHIVHGGFLSDPAQVYPSPPSASKTRISLPEEFGLYFAQLPGVLDSPAVMHRADRLPTPPPTLPLPPLDLPDPDADSYPGVDDPEGSEVDYDDEHFRSPSERSSHSADTDFPLSPISPTWDPQSPSSYAQPQLAFSSDSPPESRHIHWVWSPSPFTDRELSASDTAYAAGAGDTTTDDSRFFPRGEPTSLFGKRPMNHCHTHDIHRWSSYDYDDPLSTPFTSSSLLGDHDRDVQAPCSPRLPRLSLPEVDEDVDMSISSGDSSSSQSPSQHLLGLPGADTDDDLLPAVYAATTTSLPPLISKPDHLESSSEPLLLIGDPQDVPFIRSPSPDDLRLLSDLPAEGSQLFDMRKRYMAAEAIDPSVRGEAKRRRKRHLERSKEIGALLCLKFPDKVVKCRKEKNVENACDGASTDSGTGLVGRGNANADVNDQLQQQPEPPSHHHQQPQRPIANMAQLVAQMVFRRNETSRPLPWRKDSRTLGKSPLSRGVAASDANP